MPEPYLGIILDIGSENGKATLVRLSVSRVLNLEPLTKSG